MLLPKNSVPFEGLYASRCYNQHALRPYFDLKIDQVQLFNKAIELINLPSIFKDKSVISSIPTYFENKESLICYLYNKHIRSPVLNYNLVTELDIETTIPDS